MGHPMMVVGEGRGELPLAAAWSEGLGVPGHAVFNSTGCK